MDQWLNVRHTVMSAMGINAALAIAALAVAVNSGRTGMGLLWLGLVAVINSARAWVCLRPLPKSALEPQTAGHDQVDKYLRLSWALALFSGCVWAMVALLCDAFTSAQTLFYLALLCGITAGSVTYGIAYRWIPVAFTTPPLLTIIACLAWPPTNVDRLWLAATVALYLAALIRSAFYSERSFRQNSRLKHEATALATALQEANGRVEDALDKLHRQASHDTLTGLLNRTGFIQAAGQALDSAADAGFCLMLLDLDGFKSVNDTFGHSSGDALLHKVGHWLDTDVPRLIGGSMSEIRCGRFGGDEFVLLGRMSSGSVDDAEQAARQMVESFARQEFVCGQQLGVSIGVHTATGESLSTMLAAADEALYAAKEAGRNRYVVYDLQLQGRGVMRRSIERDLLGAIQKRQIALQYQPIVSKEGTETDEFEALLRWPHPEYGMIRPEDVVLAAAHNGLAQRLLEYVLGEALHAVGRMRHGGHAGVRVEINVSARDVSQLNIDTLILDALASHGLPPNALGVELTDVAILDIDKVQLKLGRLAEAGIGITADGFGIGNASFTLIRSRFVQRLKIDRSFVADLGRHHDSEAAIAAALGLGNVLSLEVVAEGVETQAQFEALCAMGCDRLQGNYFAPPMPLPEAVAWLATPARVH